MERTSNQKPGPGNMGLEIGIMINSLHISHRSSAPSQRRKCYPMLVINHNSCSLFPLPCPTLSRSISLHALFTQPSSTKFQPPIRIPRSPLPTLILILILICLRRRRPTKLNPQLRIPRLRHNRRAHHRRNTSPLRYRRWDTLVLRLVRLR